MDRLINEVEQLQLGDEETGILFLSGGVLPHIKYPDAPPNARYYRGNGEVYSNKGLVPSDPWPEVDLPGQVGDVCLPIRKNNGVLTNLKAVQGAIAITRADGVSLFLNLVNC